jgi:hypothetical protein
MNEYAWRARDDINSLLFIQCSKRMISGNSEQRTLTDIFSAHADYGILGAKVRNWLFERTYRQKLKEAKLDKTQ